MTFFGRSTRQPVKAATKATTQRHRSHLKAPLTELIRMLFLIFIVTLSTEMLNP